MNPIVAKYASQVGFDAGEFTWFDLTGLPDNYEDEFNEYSRQIGWDTANFALGEIPLPADNCAIIFPHGADKTPQFILTYNKHVSLQDKKHNVSYDGPAVSAYYANYPDPVPAAIICNRRNKYTNTMLHLRDDLRESFEKQDFKEMCRIMEQTMMTHPVLALAVLNRKALVSETTLTVYRGLDETPFLNKKRRAKNKPPIYNWVTVELKPSAPKREHQGGTHASPARHERRGHFRKYKSGKIAWVKPTWVGNIERGMIVHDYIPEVRA